MLAAEAALNAAHFVLLAGFLGSLLTAALLLPGGEPVELRRKLIAAASAALLAFIALHFLSLILQGAKLSGGEFPSWTTVTRYATRTQSGKVWLGREICAGLLLLGMLWVFQNGARISPVRLLFFFSLPLIAGRSLTSHAVAVKENTALVVASDSLHLVATAFWAGALPFLFWALFSGPRLVAAPLPWAAQVVSRFSRVALVSVAVLAATGLYQSWVHVGHLHALFDTSYGNVLLIKLLLFLSMLLLGAWNFIFTRPGLARGDVPGPVLQKALKKISAEALLGVLVLSVTGLLTVLPPGVHSHHFHPHPAANRGLKLIKLEPAEGASITLISPRPGQVFKGTRSLLILGSPKESAGSTCTHTWTAS